MKSKVKGKVRISRKSTLIIKGPVTIEGLELDGAVTLTGSGVKKSMVVQNAGDQLVALTQEELAARPPGCKIRGYRLVESEMLLAVCHPSSPPAIRDNVDCVACLRSVITWVRSQLCSSNL